MINPVDLADKAWRLHLEKPSMAVAWNYLSNHENEAVAGNVEAVWQLDWLRRYFDNGQDFDKTNELFYNE